MNLSEFQNKDVVNLYDGKKFGNIVDCKIDPGTGKISSFIIEPFKGVFSFRGTNKIEVSYEKISKIGEDVILINYRD